MDDLFHRGRHVHPLALEALPVWLAVRYVPSEVIPVQSAATVFQAE
jgi:hypothetical protein